jgi:hypothetical protein
MQLKHVGSVLVICCFSVGCLVEAGSSWSDAQPEARERFVCTFGASQRFIDIYRLASHGPRGAGCRVDYTKNGLTKPVWSSSGDYAYCVKQAVGLVTQLSKGHFSCRPQTAGQDGVSDSAAPDSTPR